MGTVETQLTELNLNLKFALRGRGSLAVPRMRSGKNFINSLTENFLKERSLHFLQEKEEKLTQQVEQLTAVVNELSR